MPESITVSRVIPAHAERIFTAWLDAEEHAKMTGSSATAGPDGTFTAGGGYITGRTLESTPNSRIVQSWRSTEFPQDAPDSTLTVTLEELGDEGTQVTLTQEGIPEGQSEAFIDGWEKFYFDPMTKYFASTESKLREVGEAIEEVVEKTTEAVEQAIEEAKEDLGETAKEAKEVIQTAKKAVKKVQKRAVAKAKAIGKKVTKLLAPKPKAGAKSANPKAAAKSAKPKAAAKNAKPKAAVKKSAAKPLAKKAAPKKAAPKAGKAAVAKKKVAGRRR